MNDDDDDKGGFGRPPKAFRFKPGQSGCPSGGHDRRKANKKAKEEAAAKKEKEKEKSLVDIVRKLAGEAIKVKKNGEVTTIPRLEATLRRILDKALQPEAGPRDSANAMNLYKHAKLLDPPSQKPRSSVLVVYPIMEKDEWIKATEGELLTRDPLEGIPGTEGLLETKLPRGKLPGDED